MENSEDSVKQEIMAPVVWQVGVLLKENYGKLKSLLLVDKSQPLDIIKNPTDEYLTSVAQRAIKERKLYVNLADGSGEKALDFAEISKIFSSQKGGEILNLDVLIPKEETINKVSAAVSAAKSEAGELGFNLGSFGVILSAFFKLVGNLLSGKGLNWKLAKAEAGVPYTQEILTGKLENLAAEDVHVRDFLAQKNGEKTVQDSILAAVPAKVYGSFYLEVPEQFKQVASVNPIPAAALGAEVAITPDNIRREILFPKDKEGKEGNLAQQIAEKIYAGSQAKSAEAQRAYNNASTLDTPAAYTTLEITKELALRSPEDARKMSEVAAGAIADGFTKALEDPKFAGLNQAQAAAFINEKVAAELEKNKNNLVIEGRLLSDGNQNLAWAAEKIGQDKNFPQKTGYYTYAVVTLDTIKGDIVKDINSKLADNAVYTKLQQASTLMIATQRQAVVDAGKGLNGTAVVDCTQVPVSSGLTTAARQDSTVCRGQS